MPRLQDRRLEGHRRIAQAADGCLASLSIPITTVRFLMRLPNTIRLVPAQRLTVAQRQALCCLAPGHVSRHPETSSTIRLSSASTVSLDSRRGAGRNSMRRALHQMRGLA